MASASPLAADSPQQGSELSERLRWTILGLLSLSITLNLMDRQILSVVAPVLRQQLHLTNTGYAFIVFAFQLGMVLGQIPAGMLMDSKGTRFGMAVILGAWSIFNGLHSMARTVTAFFVLRLLMGFSECGNYTGGIKAIARFFPADRRAFSGGIFNAGAQFGSVLAPPIIVFITLRWGWPMAFLLPSILGLFWIIPWLRTYPRNDVVERDAPSGAAAAPPVRISALLRNRQVWGFVLQRFFTGPLFSFYWYWLPEYLKTARGMSFFLIGLMAWIPYLFGTFGNLGGGFVSDRLIRNGMSMDAARKLCFCAGLGLSAFSLAVPFVHSNAVAVGVICLVVFGNNWTAATYIGTIGDMFAPRIVGRVNGIVGAGDSASGMISMLLTGVVVDHYSYFPILIAAGILPLLSIASIFLVVRKIEPVPESAFQQA